MSSIREGFVELLAAHGVEPLVEPVWSRDWWLNQLEEDFGAELPAPARELLGFVGTIVDPIGPSINLRDHFLICRRDEFRSARSMLVETELWGDRPTLETLGFSLRDVAPVGYFDGAVLGVVTGEHRYQHLGKHPVVYSFQADEHLEAPSLEVLLPAQASWLATPKAERAERPDIPGFPVVP